jgi:RNA polymerase sigma-70 factor (ECF subfamily)
MRDAAHTESQDATLVEALRGGDEVAFATLVNQYQATLTRLAMLYVRDRAVAEDVVQETWLGALRGLAQFEGRASLKTWLFRILVNRARTRASREDRTVAFSMLANLELETFEPALEPTRFRDADDERWPGHWRVPPSAEDLPEQRLLADELLARVRSALDELPPAQREVVRLRDIDGWTGDEVCQALDVSDANQRVLLHRGRSKIRAALETYLMHERSAGSTSTPRIS